MNDYLKKHPWVAYTLIVVLLLSLNIFWRWRNGDAWTDVLLFSFLGTFFIGGGVIAGSRWRRKQNLKNAATKKKIDELLQKK